MKNLIITLCLMLGTSVSFSQDLGVSLGESSSKKKDDEDRKRDYIEKCKKYPKKCSRKILFPKPTGPSKPKPKK